MKISNTQHLCYCLNIFRPFKSPAELDILFKKIKALKKELSQPDSESFAIGIWVNKNFLAFLEEQKNLNTLKEKMEQEKIYTYSFNVFPFEQFHDASIKEKVYFPDWMENARVDFTCRAARLLSRLIPDEVQGSLSTVPGTYTDKISKHNLSVIQKNFLKTGQFLASLFQDTGKKILLAVEPEPDCLWSSARDFTDFYSTHLAEFPNKAEYIGICYDTAHHELAEDGPGKQFDYCIINNVNIAKIQFSSALGSPENSSKDELAKFADEVYLHQTKIFKNNKIIAKFADLPHALAKADRNLHWKIHYHIPLYVNKMPHGLIAEKHELETVLKKCKEKPEICSNLEIETYTYDILPNNVKISPIEKSMAEEYSFIINKICKQ